MYKIIKQYSVRKASYTFSSFFYKITDENIFISFLPKTFPKCLLTSFGDKKKRPGSQKHENLLDTLI